MLFRVSNLGQIKESSSTLCAKLAIEEGLSYSFIAMTLLFYLYSFVKYVTVLLQMFCFSVLKMSKSFSIVNAKAKRRDENIDGNSFLVN